MPSNVFLVEKDSKQTLVLGRKQGDQIIGEVIGITLAQLERLEQVWDAKICGDRKADSKGKQKTRKNG